MRRPRLLPCVALTAAAIAGPAAAATRDEPMRTLPLSTVDQRVAGTTHDFVTGGVHVKVPRAFKNFTVDGDDALLTLGGGPDGATLTVTVTPRVGPAGDPMGLIDRLMTESDEDQGHVLERALRDHGRRAWVVVTAGPMGLSGAAVVVRLRQPQPAVSPELDEYLVVCAGISNAGALSAARIRRTLRRFVRSVRVDPGTRVERQDS